MPESTRISLRAFPVIGVTCMGWRFTPISSTTVDADSACYRQEENNENETACQNYMSDFSQTGGRKMRKISSLSF